MSLNISALWKSHSDEPGTQHVHAGRDQNFGSFPNDMAFLEEEDLDHLGFLYQKPETD